MQTTIKAFHLKRGIDIKEVKAKIKLSPVAESNTELFYKTDDSKYFSIINYGAIAFYNHSADEINHIIKSLVELYPISSTDLLVDDFGLIEDKNAYIIVEFSQMTINTVDEGAIKIILLNMAQSIALTYYDSVSQELVSQVRLFTTEMEQKGKLKITKKNILKFIGRTLNTQNRIAENLYIFDAPAITWENEYYNAINTTLAKHFELSARFKSIESTFKILEANLHAFLEVNHHRESSKLEWIIIILILVEVIDTFVMKLF